MRIAQIAPLIERVPPKKYGGTERVISALTEELVARGHEVTLFASGDSITAAKLGSVYPRSLRDAKLPDLYGSNVLSMLNIGLAYQRQAEFDLIHDHNGHLSLPTANLALTPVVMTLHGNLTPADRRLYGALKRPHLVGISQSQIAVMTTGMNILGYVYNGLNLESYPYSEEHDGYLLFVGRISMEKGLHVAIEAAQYHNLPLVIAAKLDEVDLPYYEKYIAPRLSEEVRWVGEVDEKERNRLMSRALCLLHTATWREPFGLTMIEAMACGCPVIGFNRGSVPEVVEDGKTGFVVDDLEELLESILEIDNISRAECRHRALSNFTSKKMADGYEKIYNRILSGSGQHEQ